MISQDEIKRVDSGSGYFIGEIERQHKDLTYLRPGTIVTLFDGVDKALDFVTEKMPKAKRGCSSDKRDRDEFNAFGSYAEAMDTFRKHPEKVVKFDPSELRIKDESEAGNNVEYDVTGDFIDMGRYMEGIPESVGTMRSGNARNRRVNMVINVNSSWRIDHHVITHRGERILRLVDALEAGGVRTQLTAIESSECNHTEVVLKHHDEPLTIADLAVVTHPEFLRRIVFRIIEHSKTYSSGYGSAYDFGRALRPEVIDSGTNDELDIVVDSNIDSIEDVDRLFDQLERLLVWEMSKPVPEVTSVKIGDDGIFFSPNGVRSEAEIRQEGQEAIRDE